MKTSGGKFSGAFKAQVAIEALKERDSLAGLSKKFEVLPNMISKWKQELTSSVRSWSCRVHTRCICHKGFSGYLSVEARSNFGVSGQDRPRNPLRHIHSTVSANTNKTKITFK